ncbi:putative solute carrier family 29 (equilibrative nucleoside transporter), member 1/2/3 [Monocercomonoides exilis]|uniref:putative solute carrier family 29 (equilibrative nucleoside transporter), member 1/2/3 n=1 Tax=Monocercomonoides exilis TaxID=2049356 RepID=UPI00355A8ADD|nr:putative solute carrier family 29 (equilibrative nucleoside transporter), member 1/2/3 [Monocercomonoides exilis]
MAVLSAWNGIISSANFFLKRLPGNNNMSFMLAAYHVGSLPTLLICTGISGHINRNYAVPIPIFISVLIMIIIPIVCTFLDGTIAAVVLMLILSFFLGIITGCLNVTIFGLSSQLSPLHTQSTMIGQALDGLISLVPLILHISLPGDNTDLIGYIFFAFSAVINALAFVGYWILTILPYSKEKLRSSKKIGVDDARSEINEETKAKQNGKIAAQEVELSVLDVTCLEVDTKRDEETHGENLKEEEVNSEPIEGKNGRNEQISEIKNEEEMKNENIDNLVQSSYDSHQKIEDNQILQSSSPLLDSSFQIDSQLSLISSPSSTNSSLTVANNETLCGSLRSQFIQMFHIAKKKFWWGLSGFLCFFVSLLVFPNIIIAVPPPKGMFEDEWGHELWTNIKLNIFNVLDFAVRFFPTCFPLYKSVLAMNVVSLLRLVIAALLFLSLYIESCQHLWYPIVFQSLLAITNGYHSTLIMALACEDLTDEKEKIIGGSFMSASLNIGLFAGTISSTIIVSLIL